MVIHTGWKHRSWIVIALLICGAVSAQESSRAGGGRRLSLPESPHQYSEMGIPALRGRNVRQRGRFGRRSDNTPGDNPITDLGATLGRVLFYDTRLSVDGTVSCASCHLQKNAFADPRRVSVGIEGRAGKRNAPSLVNARYNSNGRFFWDERAGSLEEQVLMPIQDPVEMGFELEDLVERLDSIPEYRELFAGAFGATDVTEDRISKALAQFVRSLVSYRSRFDEGLAQAGAVANDFPNFTAQENLGKSIFFGRNDRGGGSCASCHTDRGGRRGRGGQANPVLFVARQASNNGLDAEVGGDNGVGDVTGRDRDNGRFKVPSLRGVGVTAPYMHDARFATLEEVVEFYDSGVQGHPNLDRRLSRGGRGGRGRRGFGRGGGFRPPTSPRRMNLTDSEKKGLVAFLKTLTDSQFLGDPRFSDPFR
ncbi:MAG: cytochrome-c peroxidase [Acidobacteria bacterium]|nr:cytochrome-c peroxidase [Acidobacteriota bacterium]